MDKISVQRIDTLLLSLRAEALLILQDCDKALTGRAKVRYTCTWRSYKEQNDLYELGRTVVNPNGKTNARPFGYKVTNAKGGYSMHNFGLAIDIALIIDNKSISWDDVKDFDTDGHSDWMEVVAIFKKHGWQWGGDWSSFIDKPHFQKTFGYTTAQLRALRAASGETYLNIGPKTNQYITTTDLNMRSGPEVTNSLILVLPKGSIVNELIRNDVGWSKIQFGPKEGWVNNKYLTIWQKK